MKNTPTEISESHRLLDDKGHLIKGGYCRRNYYIYNKDVIKKHRWRLKEWDYYMISDGRFLTELNFYNISIWAALTAEITDLKTGERFGDFIIEPSYPNKYEMSPAADKPFRFSYKRFGRKAVFTSGNSSHRLCFKGRCKGKEFEVNIEGKRLPDQESLTTATPFKQKHCFFYTQKLNCIRAKGTVKAAGRIIKYNPENTYMVMDWGRGIWPWRNTWYWSNASSTLNGKLFGFEITWGFGIEKYSEQTALFYDGKCHKIGKVRLKHDPEKSGWMKPWHFTSSDGRLDLILTPRLLKQSGMIFLRLIGMKSNQVFGEFNGFAILDDGTKLDVKNMKGFAEKVHNCW